MMARKTVAQLELELASRQAAAPEPEPAPAPPMPPVQSRFNWAVIVVLVLAVAQSLLTTWTQNRVDSGAMTAEQAKRLTDGLESIAELVKPLTMARAAADGDVAPEWVAPLVEDAIRRVKTTDPPPPDPDPAPPRPNPPGPTPTPGDLKIVITDRTGKPVTSATVEPHMLCSVTTNGLKSDVSWHTDGNGSSSVMTLPENLGYAFFLEPDAWVSFTVTDRSLSKTSIRITANHGPQPPPPIPVPPIPVPPDVEPVPPIPITARHLQFVIVENPLQRTPAQVKMQMDGAMWERLAIRGHSHVLVDSKTQGVHKRFATEVGALPLPQMLVRDSSADTTLEIVPFPSDPETLATKWGAK